MLAGMRRPNAGSHWTRQIFRTQLVDDIDGRFLVDVECDIALALEVLTRHHRELVVTAGSELFPLIVGPPQPPIEPASRSFEKCAVQFISAKAQPYVSARANAANTTSRHQ